MSTNGPNGPGNQGDRPDDGGYQDYGISFNVPMEQMHQPPPSPPPGAPQGGSRGPMGVPTRVRGIKSHPEGTTILVLGILSMVICPLIGPLAWSMGNKAMAEVRYSGYRISNAGLIRAGRLLGAISTVLMLLILAAYLLLFCSAYDDAGNVRREPVPAPAISVPVASVPLAPVP